MPLSFWNQHYGKHLWPLWWSNTQQRSHKSSFCLCTHAYSRRKENAIKWRESSKTRTSDSSALKTFHVGSSRSSKQSVHLPWKAVFLHQMAAVEMKQLVRVVIFRGANSLPLSKCLSASEVLLPIAPQDSPNPSDNRSLFHWCHRECAADSDAHAYILLLVPLSAFTSTQGSWILLVSLHLKKCT